MVRAFVGFMIPDDIKRYVISVQAQLIYLPIKAKFVEPENLHVSLSFLGDIPDIEIEKIKFKLDEISKAYEKFELVLGDIILIPSENYVRVMALDITSERLESLRKNVVKSIGGKSHSTHLTLARIKTVEEKRKVSEGIRKITIRKIPVKVDNICLIGSMLQESGPVYTILNKTYLR